MINYKIKHSNKCINVINLDHPYLQNKHNTAEIFTPKGTYKLIYPHLHKHLYIYAEPPIQIHIPKKMKNEIQSFISGH